MHPEVEKAEREIIKAFNSKSKIGIQKIKEICREKNISPVEKEIADFFIQQRQNLDLEAVGDYLSSPEAECGRVLQAFTAEMDFRGQSFTEGLRNFLRTFKLPGEAQKIDRLVAGFSAAYVAQNPGGKISDQDAAYVLSFQVIMLNTDLHNPGQKNKMSLEALKKNLRGVNGGNNFDPEFLTEIYNGIKETPFEFNFVKTSPGYEIIDSALDHDITFQNLNALIKSKKSLQDVFRGVGDEFTATVSQTKSWLNFLFGYEGSVTIKDKELTDVVTIQVYNPGFISKWFLGEQPKVIIQPVFKDENQQKPLELAAIIAANFAPEVSSTKGTYDYERSDLRNAYQQQKNISQQLFAKARFFNSPKTHSQPEHTNEDIQRKKNT
jgi:guanine nucleotide exchange protein RalF